MGFKPEARPLSWIDLNDQQKKAFSKILGMLSDKVGENDSSDLYNERIEIQGSFAFDRFRSNQVIFLGGERGSGKTSLYLTLRKYLSAIRGRGSVLDKEIEELNREIDASKRNKKRLNDRQVYGIQEKISLVINELNPIASAIRMLLPSLIWLPTLDMEPLPRHTNLLVAVLLRLEKALEYYLADVGSGKSDQEIQECSPFVDPGTSPLVQLRQLIRETAATWNGNLHHRAGSIDPDTYAQETRRVESGRIALSQELNKILNRISECIINSPKYVSDRQPLFILPIDDFDLCPANAIELLTLLRMLSVQRLVILVLGSIRLAETVFNLKMVGDFTELMGNPRRPEHISVMGEDLGGIIRQVSANALRKLLPPHQRIHLSNSVPSQSIRFRPQGESMCLSDLLKKAEVQFETAARENKKSKKKTYQVGPIKIESLFDFLFPFGYSYIINPEYSGTDILKSPPRQLADLWYLLRDEIDKDSISIDKLMNVIAYETQRNVHEDQYLELNSREELLNSFDRDSQENWQLDLHRFKVSLQTSRGIEIEGLWGGRIHVPRFRSWLIQVPKANKGIPDTLSNSKAAASIILFHDLLALRENEGIVGEGLPPKPFEYESVYTEWDLGPGREVRFNWPTPNWNSFWEFDLLNSLLKKVELFVQPFSIQNESLAFLWIGGISWMLFPEEETVKKSKTKSEMGRSISQVLKEFFNFQENRIDQSISNDCWKIIFMTIKEEYLIEKSLASTARTERIRSWIIALTCLAAPEYGLPENVARNLKACFENEIWCSEEIARDVRHYRAQRLAQFLSAGYYAYFRLFSGRISDSLIKELGSKKDLKSWWQTLNSEKEIDEILSDSTENLVYFDQKTSNSTELNKELKTSVPKGMYITRNIFESIRNHPFNRLEGLKPGSDEIGVIENEMLRIRARKEKEILDSGIEERISRLEEVFEI